MEQDRLKVEAAVAVGDDGIKKRIEKIEAKTKKE